MECLRSCIVLVLLGGAKLSAPTVLAFGDPNSVFCYSNPCQNNGTCVNMRRPGSDQSLSFCKNDLCYKLILERNTWEEATIACSVMGASLVSLDTSEKEQALVNTIKDYRLHRTQSSPNNPGGFWSSGNNLLLEDQWTWGADPNRPVMSGSFPPYVSRTRRCLMLNTDLMIWSRIQLATEICERRLYFACELTPEALYQERTFQCLCEEGYFGEFCERTLDLQTETVCSDALLNLTCDLNKHLTIIRGTYHLDSGREVCSETSGVRPTVNCVLRTNLNHFLENKHLSKCEGRQRCTTIVADDTIRSSDDWCLSHPIYAKVEYGCQDTFSMHTCQSSMAKLSCENSTGQPFIRVEVATYGRLHSSAHCADSTLQPGQLPVTDCRSINTLDLVAGRCNGLPSCNIQASDDVFGDPCKGVYKKLDITYRCVENLTAASATYPLTYGIATLPPPVLCPAVNHSGVVWRPTREGQSDVQRCPNGQDGLAYWLCDRQTHGQWSTMGPDLSRCTSPWINNIYKQIESGSESASFLAKLVLNNTASSTAQNSDFQKSLSLMDDLLKLQDKQLLRLDEEEQQSTVEAFGEIVIKFGSNVLDSDKQDTWASLTANDGSSESSAAVTPTDVTENLENTGFLVAQYLGPDKSHVTIHSENILMAVEVVPKEKTGKAVYFQDTRKTDDGTNSVRHTITLPPSATNITGIGSTQVVFLVYESLGEYLTDTAIDEGVQGIRGSLNESDYALDNKTDGSIGLMLNSAVVSASAKKHEEQLTTFENEEEIQLTIKHALPNITGNVTCVFWNTSKSLGKSGAWSNNGCRLVSSNLTHSICACNHLTNFAILMDVTGTHTTIAPVHEKILTVLTYVGCAVSIVCLLLSFCAFTFFKNIWSLRVTIHRNLCFMLLVANALFVAGVEQTQIKTLCSVIAGLLQYSFLSAFVWMSLEAVQFYIMLVHVFSTQSRRWPYYLAGYGIPAIVVGVSAGINHSGYGTDRYCWLTTDDSFIWSFTGPVAIIIAVNLVLLVVSLRIAYSSRSSINKGITQNDIRPWIKGATTLLFLLGITWGIGFFFINQQSLVMAYIFTILNSLQGLFIFIFYCLGNERVNSELRKFLNRQEWLPACIRKRYGRDTTSSHSWVLKSSLVFCSPNQKIVKLPESERGYHSPSSDTPP
ncbi:adhesion G protein-coupled receptor L2-like isoform X2 [Acanthaster planci]|uniref:Adhesion G protein-coupled receptor L2-like isoform X2 n=1 Tax=Acanthaster planci TaxID=133434 RepID=A0A8B7YUW3_ACAPL|nr:adhesion G protein-coupled receptor L2-like isoform X2 [Acanthaster planci]